MTKLYKSAVSKMSLIQPKKFRTWETGLFKMPRLETPRFQTAVKVTVASAHWSGPHLKYFLKIGLFELFGS